MKGENLIAEKLIDYKKLIQSELYQNDLHDLASMLKNINLDILVKDPDEHNNDKNLLVFFISMLLKYFKSYYNLLKNTITL